MSTLILRKRKKSFELPQQLYGDGMRLVKLRLLELHPEYDYIIKNVYLKLLAKRDLLQKISESLIVESAPKTSLMILIDKSIFSNPVTLTMNWLRILGAVLTLKEKDCREFWSYQCEENSKRLWFPTEIGCVGSGLSLSNGFLPKTIQGSWFLTKQSINPVAKISQKTFLPSFKYSPVKKWEKEGIRAIRIKLNPTKKQKLILEKWSNTTRYVYNKCLAKILKDPSLNNNKGYSKLKKECIIAKNNNIIKANEEPREDKFLYDWEIETPKDIRNGALRDIEKAYKTAFANITAGNIQHFGLGFRKKKSYANQSLEVPKSAIKLIKTKKTNGFVIYTTKLHSVIAVHKSYIKLFKTLKLTHDTRLKKENNEWYLCVGRDIKGSEDTITEKTCALDPGVRKFQTIYSEDKVISISPDKVKVKKIYAILDKFQSLRAKKKISKQTYDKRRCRTQAKLTNLVDDMHYKTIAFLTKNYTSILLPSFETQDMVCSNKLHSKVKRDMMNFSYYKFKQRLQHKCSLIKHCDVTIVNEAFTSQTCGYCGKLNKTSNEIIHCSKCNKSYDRDVNGSRNIYLKYITTSK
jgi:putative transposase